MPRNIKRALTAAHSLTAAASISPVLAAAGEATDRSQGVPALRFHAALLVGYLSSIANAPTTVTLRICRDAAGDEPFTPAYVATIVLGATNPTDGSVSVALDMPLAFAPGTVFHVVAILDAAASTATCIWELIFIPGG
jgi:hypothetical protein